MYKVFFTRQERNDPLVLAKDAINEAIFKREAADLGLPVEQDPSVGEDNLLGWVVLVAPQEGAVLRSFLQAMVPLDLPCLSVAVPEAELADWERDALNDDYSFYVE